MAAAAEDFPAVSGTDTGVKNVKQFKNSTWSSKIMIYNSIYT